jgi:hypothetical protein
MKMRLSATTIGALAEILLNEPYRSGPALIEFFANFGERDLYGAGFPARITYATDKLTELNGTEKLEAALRSAFDLIPDLNDAEGLAFKFNRQLAKDGYALTIAESPGFMDGSKYVPGPPYFKVLRRDEVVNSPEKLIALNSDAIAEQISKARDRISRRDYAGSISACYTLVEELLKLLLRRHSELRSPDEGDIRQLYKVLKKEIGLDASGDMDPTLNPILDGLQKLVAGLYGLSNHAGDRHARKYNPAQRHAKLAVNATFALSEFLLEVSDLRSAVES